MSRGPGKIERAITDLLVSKPAGTFMVEDLAAVAYPGLNRIEKKHRVSILRAVNKTNNTDGTWWWWGSANYVKGAPSILFNRLNLRSLGVKDARKQESIRISDEEAEAKALDPKSQTYPYILEGGPYPVLVEYYRATDEEQQRHLWEVYKALVHKVVYSRKTIEGNVHPDFLRDCVTVE